MVYRHSVSLTPQQPTPCLPKTTRRILEVNVEPLDFLPSPRGRFPKRTYDEEEEIALFRRVRIKTSIKLTATDSRSTSPTSNLDEHPGTEEEEEEVKRSSSHLS